MYTFSRNSHSTHLLPPAVALLAALHHAVAADGRSPVGHSVQAGSIEKALASIVLQEGSKVPDAAAAKGFCPTDTSKIKQLSIYTLTHLPPFTLKISGQLKDSFRCRHKAQRFPGCLSGHLPALSLERITNRDWEAFRNIVLLKWKVSISQVKSLLYTSSFL